MSQLQTKYGAVLEWVFKKIFKKSFQIWSHIILRFILSHPFKVHFFISEFLLISSLLKPKLLFLNNGPRWTAVHYRFGCRCAFAYIQALTYMPTGLPV